MPQQRSKRSRKRRKAGPTQRGTAPPASPPRREQRAERQAQAVREQRRSQRQLGTEGERPPGPFGGVPVSEVAIFAGLVALVVWLIRGGTTTLVVGIAVCVLGVVEVTAREHFAGYRSHTTLLAAIPAMCIAVGLVTLTGEGRGHAPLLFTAIPVFALCFWLLRKRFQTARQARITRLRSLR